MQVHIPVTCPMSACKALCGAVATESMQPGLKKAVVTMRNTKDGIVGLSVDSPRMIDTLEDANG